MNTMLRNFLLGAALVVGAGHASASTLQVIEEAAGDERISTLNADGNFQVIYSLNVCPLTTGQILVVTSESQVQNSSVTHDILFAAQLRRDTTTSTGGISMDNEGNGTNIAPHDYRLVSPKVVITTVGTGITQTGSCVINYLGRAASTQGGSMSVVNNRGRLQVLKITP